MLSETRANCSRIRFPIRFRLKLKIFMCECYTEKRSVEIRFLIWFVLKLKIFIIIIIIGLKDYGRWSVNEALYIDNKYI